MSAPSVEQGPNADQARYWNEEAGPRWREMQERMDAQFGPLSQLAMDSFGVKPGERVLDVGCGCGGTSLELARRVGSEGSVLGVDLSEPMLGRARERAAGAANLEFRQADAQTADVGSGEFDLVFSRFGVMFFTDPLAAFRNLHRSLRAGGRLGFACWQDIRKNPFMFEPMAAAAAHIELPPRGDPNAPGPFAFADPERVRGILEGAGFRDVRIDPWAGEIGVGSPEQAVEFYFQIGPLSRALTEIGAGPDLIDKVRGSLREVTARYESDGRVSLPANLWMVSALA